MADEVPPGLPIGAAPVVGGMYRLGQEEEERVRCLLAGAILGQESITLLDGIEELGRANTAYQTAEVGSVESMLPKAWVDLIADKRKRIAKLVPELVRCGIPSDGKIAKAWEKADRSLRTLIARPEDERTGPEAHSDMVGLIHVVQIAANTAGIDPPVIRNVRRIEALRTPPGSKP